MSSQKRRLWRSDVSKTWNALLKKKWAASLNSLTYMKDEVLHRLLHQGTKKRKAAQVPQEATPKEVRIGLFYPANFCFCCLQYSSARRVGLAFCLFQIKTDRFSLFLQILPCHLIFVKSKCKWSILDFPLAELCSPPPVLRKCAVQDCNHARKYDCAKSLLPACSLKCSKILEKA